MHVCVCVCACVCVFLGLKVLKECKLNMKIKVRFNSWPSFAYEEKWQLPVSHRSSVH